MTRVPDIHDGYIVNAYQTDNHWRTPIDSCLVRREPSGERLQSFLSASCRTENVSPDGIFNGKLAEFVVAYTWQGPKIIRSGSGIYHPFRGQENEQVHYGNGEPGLIYTAEREIEVFGFEQLLSQLKERSEETSNLYLRVSWEVDGLGYELIAPANYLNYPGKEALHREEAYIQPICGSVLIELDGRFFTAFVASHMQGQGTRRTELLVRERTNLFETKKGYVGPRFIRILRILAKPFVSLLLTDEFCRRVEVSAQCQIFRYADQEPLGRIVCGATGEPPPLGPVTVSRPVARRRHLGAKIPGIHVKSFLRVIVNICANAFGVFVLALLYVIEPFWKIRITHFSAERIGHLSGDIFVYLARQPLGQEPRRSSQVLLTGPPCNRHLLTMWQRKLPVVENWLTSKLWYSCKNILRRSRFDIPGEHTDDDHFEFSQAGPRLSFNDQDEIRGGELLNEMGLGPDDWFVVLHVGDPAITRHRLPEMSEVELTAAMHKPSVRHGNILGYLPAADHVTEQGGFVLRTGSVVESPLPDTGNPKVIDYSTNHRSDFGDVYLAGKARFYLGGPSGLPQLSTIFGVPVALASMVPLTPHCIGPQGLYLPVLLRREESGELLHYREAYDMGMFGVVPSKRVDHGSGFAAVRVTVEQSNADDILDLAKDMLDQANGVAPPDGTAEIQHFYRERYTSQAKSYRYAPTIAPRFALKYKELIIE